ncbi:MAG: hypothetical protein ACLGI5_20725 [Thermoleophilia bacterium]
MPIYPYVRADLRSRALAVVLNDREIVATRRFDDAHLVDIDAEDDVVGLEILTLDDLKIDEMATRFDFVDQVPAIRDAIARVLSPPTAVTASLRAPLIVQGTSRPGPSEAEAESASPIWEIV